MLMIRLQRTGRKHDPHFRVIVTEKTRGPKSGKFVEQLGFYNPKVGKIELKEDRIKHWLENGAKASGTVHNFLVDQGIVKGEKVDVLGKKKSKKEEKKEEEKPKAESGEEKPAEDKTEEAAEEPAKEEAPQEEVKEEEAPAEEPKEEAKEEPKAETQEETTEEKAEEPEEKQEDK